MGKDRTILIVMLVQQMKKNLCCHAARIFMSSEFVTYWFPEVQSVGFAPSKNPRFMKALALQRNSIYESSASLMTVNTTYISHKVCEICLQWHDKWNHLSMCFKLTSIPFESWIWRKISLTDLCKLQKSVLGFSWGPPSGIVACWTDPQRDNYACK